MIGSRITLVMLATALLAASVSASAHHYMGAFDQANARDLTGTVKSWQWTNPHTWLILTVKDEKGKEQQWALEGVSPILWQRRGVVRNVIKAGDIVTVRMSPRKDGKLEAGLDGILMINGKPGPGSFAPPPSERPRSLRPSGAGSQ